LTAQVITTMTESNFPRQFAIALHGGAGMELARRTPAEQVQLKESLRRALEAGRQVLASSGTALDAVEQTVRVLEDDPRFNAGRGAVLNSQGQHELDASIMDGATTQAGAVAGVTTVKHPIALARLVMTHTRNVLLH
jgi:L-asparaginase / beta-aspartyl-peptidase